jgi:hypothetical protein
LSHPADQRTLSICPREIPRERRAKLRAPRPHRRPAERRADTPKDEDWNKKWKLLDDSFKMMVDGLGGLGKKIAPAITELIGAKFNFGPDLYYFEKKEAKTSA